MLYTFLIMKWLHVLAVIAVVGLHAAYGVWIVRGYNHNEALPFALRTVKLLDDWVALPAFAVVLLSGAAMVGTTGTSLRTPWLLAGLVLFAVLIVTHLVVYRPTLQQLIQLVDRNELVAAEFRAAADRERNVGIAMVLAMIAIVFLMVVKPTLWG